MNEVIITSTILNIGMALIAFIMAWLMLRFLDRVSGVNFRIKLMRMDEYALAHYLGYRILAICILVGLAAF